MFSIIILIDKLFRKKNWFDFKICNRKNFLILKMKARGATKSQRCTSDVAYILPYPPVLFPEGYDKV